MISAIIPTYNEKENVGLLLSGLSSAIGSTGQDYEIIVVDDNSPDGTASLVMALSKKDPRIRLVKRDGKLGLTSAVKEGVLASRGDRIIVMDADMSHPPEMVPLLARTLDRADLVIGSRLIKGGGVENWPLHRRLISRAADFLAHVLLGIRCTDPLSGFFAVRKDVFLRTRFRTLGYKLLLNLLADNPGIRVIELPYTFRDRHAGKTKLGSGEMVQYLFDLFRIRLGKKQDGGPLK
ncbi:MAG: polyprenol monophosphomannose synthase [Candidatus Micrarchaeota archaeon]